MYVTTKYLESLLFILFINTYIYHWSNPIYSLLVGKAIILGIGGIHKENKVQ